MTNSTQQLEHLIEEDDRPIKLNYDSMPEYVKQELAASAWKAIQLFMTRPDAREILDAEKARLEAEESTLLTRR